MSAFPTSMSRLGGSPPAAPAKQKSAFRRAISYLASEEQRPMLTAVAKGVAFVLGVMLVRTAGEALTLTDFNDPTIGGEGPVQHYVEGQNASAAAVAAGSGAAGAPPGTI